MPTRIIESNLPLTAIPAAEFSGGCSSYADLESISSLGKLCVESWSVLSAIAAFAANEGRNNGYTKKSISPVTTRLLLAVHPVETAKKAVNYLNEVREDYCSLRDGGTLTQEDIAELPQRFSSRLLEVIAIEMLIKSGRKEQDTTLDAHLTFGDSRPSSRNIDIVWSVESLQVAEAYECKLKPRVLFYPYYRKDWLGHDKDIEDSQLGLMLKLQSTLQARTWHAHLGCVTFSRRSSVEAELAKEGKRPDEVTVYCLESLRDKFPPPLPE